MSEHVYRAGDRVKVDATVTDAGPGWVGIRVGEFGKPITAAPELVHFISREFHPGEKVRFAGVSNNATFSVMTVVDDWVVMMPIRKDTVPFKPVVALAAELELVEQPEAAVPPTEVMDT